MRAVRGSLGHSPKERWSELKGPYPRAAGDLFEPPQLTYTSKLGRTIFGCSLRPCLGQDASLGEETVLADSGREGEITGRVGRVRSLAFLSSLRECPVLRIAERGDRLQRLITRNSPGRIVGPERLFFVLSVLSGMRNRFDTFPSVSPMRTLYQREGPAVTNCAFAGNCGNL